MVANKLSQNPSNPIEVHNVKTLKQKLSEFSSEIGLTKDEITMMIFTVIDMSWLTNMIIMSGDFTKWFNINFSEESRDKLDFRDKRLDNWEAALTYAELVLVEYQTVRAPNVTVDLMSSKWW